MKYQVLSSVIVIPSELSKIFYEILKDPEASLNYLDIDKIIDDDSLTYFRFNNYEEEFHHLENVLDDNWFPFNFYPSNLGDVVTINRFNEKGMFIGATMEYSAFLEIKLHGEKSPYYENCKDKLGLEHNWENQVDNFLTSRLLNIL